jgi:SAM-dependent methyltransferase
VAWDPDNPFLSSAALGETASGARHLPEFLCSFLDPGPVLILGASEAAFTAARSHDVTVVDWSSRRLAEFSECARDRCMPVRAICRDPERQDLGVVPRSFANALCLDGLERFRDEVGVLEKLEHALIPGGKLVVRVPACRWVREETTRGSRRARTYDAEMLREALEEASLRTLRIRHWNAVGVPCAFVWDRLLRRPHPDHARDFGKSAPSWWWSTLDVWFRAVENRVGFPVGVSLVAVSTPYRERAKVARPAWERGVTRRAARGAYESLAASRTS